MKALFISYNMTLTERVEGLLDHYTVRGFTLFPLTHGRGSFDGEPHMGTHTWPAMNSTIIAMVEDEKMPAQAGKRDADAGHEGLRVGYHRYLIASVFLSRRRRKYISAAFGVSGSPRQDTVAVVFEQNERCRRDKMRCPNMERPKDC